MNDDLVRQALSILRGMWRRRWLGLAGAWVVGVAAAGIIMRIPDQYEASARVYVDTQSVLKPLMSGLAVQPDMGQQLLVLSRTLLTRPNLEKLIRMADLDLTTKSKEEQQQLIDSLAKRITIASAGRDNIYTLAIRDPVPDQAKRVVQSLVSMFVETGLGAKRNDADTARKFIEEQIKTYETRLQEAENRLKEFKLKHMGLNTGEGGKDYFGKMEEVRAQMNQARLELRESENSRDALKGQLAEERQIRNSDKPEDAANVSVPEIDSRIDALKRNIDSLLQHYTEEHPDVVGAKRVIERLEEQKRQEVAARKKAGTSEASSSTNENPVYQQLKVALAEAEANVASLRTRVAEYDARYNQLKQAATSVPQVEAELQQLNRDYAINKSNYDSLVSRRESAVMSRELEASSGLADFRLIDPPRVSPQPVAPNRLLLLPLALLGALAAGGAVSLVVSQLWPIIFDSRTVREVSGLPILGTVSMITSVSGRQQERRGLIGFAVGVMALIGSYAAGLVLVLMFSAPAT